MPRRQAVRHAARMTVAAVVAFAAAWAFDLPQGYWAVISAIVVMQGSLGGTLGASLDRLLATIAGAGAGAVWVLVRAHLAVPEIVLLALAVAPMALLAALRPSFRLAPITAVIVLLGATGEDGVFVAFHRMAEIALGCVIGGLTAQFVVPDRARNAIERGAAGLLEALGRVASAHLTRAGDAATDPLNDVVRRYLAGLATAATDEARERALFLCTGPPAAPLLRTLRRVRSDVAMLGRAMAIDPDIDGSAAAEALAQHFKAAAAFLRGDGPAPPLDLLDAAIGAAPATSALAFALVTLRRDLGELDERLAEQVAT
ncbi:MAG: FUSC family protein [Acetobacteraceae bacterium]|nr:FUSC family protein [Acetobacteraceae bacterium]